MAGSDDQAEEANPPLDTHFSYWSAVDTPSVPTVKRSPHLLDRWPRFRRWTSGCPPATPSPPPSAPVPLLDTAIQVKLLRVLQTRELQRIGETTARRLTLNWKTVRAKISAWMQRAPSNAGE